MAEKAFKVPSLALVGSNFALDSDGTNIRWNSLPLATKSYVDGAVAGVSVNTNAIAEALASGSLYVSEGDNLNVNANALAGDGSYVDTKIYTGNNIYGSSYLAVNVNALALRSGENGSLGKSISTGFSSLGREILFVNVNALAGTGLISGDNTGVGAKNGGDYKLLSVNVNNIASSILSTDDDTLSIGSDNLLKVNTNAVAEGLAGAGTNGLYWMTGTQNLAVNTNAIAAGIAGSGLYVSSAITGTYLAVNTNTIATKAYVDGVAQGLDIKESVNYASTGDVWLGDLYNGNNKGNAGTTSNFVTGDRVLLKNQTNKNENGIWIVSPAITAMPTRATDADSFDKLNKGSFVFVETGINGGKGYVVTYTNESGALGDAGTENSWSQFSEAGSYITSASAPFSVVNGVLSLNTTTALYLDVANVLDVNANAIVGNLDGAGLYVTGANELAVNVNALAYDGQGLYVFSQAGVDGLAVNSAIVASNLSANDYGAKSFFITNGSATTKTIVSQASTATVNTYVTVSEIDFNGTSQPHMFSADIVMAEGSKVRTSKISGTIDGATNSANYTEYAIVEQGDIISDADVRVVWDGAIERWLVQIKAGSISSSLHGVASVTSVGYFS